jgi:hypothetical protein
MASGQFTLALHRDASADLDGARREELLKALADLLLEAVGEESGGAKEENDESKDHA